MFQKRILVIALALFFMSNHFAFGQENTSISESRKEHVKELMNYRFKGGYYTFEKLAYESLKYPPYNDQICLVGMVLVDIEVNCEGEVVNVTVKNPIGLGVESDISKFLESTKGKWNNCEDDKYTHVEIPVKYKMENVETNDADAMIIIVGKNKGVVCYDDSYYLEKANKYLGKGNGKKAIPYLNQLIQRNPYNTDYYEMKKKAIELEK
jgi:hypothetical protein